MCGIIGILNTENALEKLKAGLKTIEYRGKDHTGISKISEKSYLGHRLHSVVSNIKQPIQNRFIFNGEIYNWKQLKEKYSIKAKNDTELLLELLEKQGINCLEELDGVYAFAYINKNKIYLARDIIGIKPLWFSTNPFAFASEKKALESINISNIEELNPRKILIYNIKTKEIKLKHRSFFETKPEIKEDYKEIKEKTKQLLIKAIEKRIPNKKFGILFSGGLDSALIALICKKLNKDFTCYVSGFDENASDIIYAKKIAKELNLKLKVIITKNIEEYLKKVIPLIEDTHVVKAGVALTLFTACEQAKKDKCKVIFSGLGSEQLFSGYFRDLNYYKTSKNFDFSKEGKLNLLGMYERDTYRDDVITMYNQLELRVPYLDKKFVKYALRIPSKYKTNENQDKIILREIAKELGLKEYSLRKKKSAQYGSWFDKAITKLAKQKGNYKSMYLKSFYNKPNLKLAALTSSGKDSIFSIDVMNRQNYKIEVLVTLKSKNPDSYMYHTPNIGLIKLQAQAMNIPLIEYETKGEKEIEIEDLYKALKLAKQKYKIQGVVSGALYSNYQRERIIQVCERLGIKFYNPIWHMDLNAYMKEIANRFTVIISSIAADGLDKSYLGKEINSEMLKKLDKLNKKNNINVAFEGGEAESLVLDAPMFKKKIEIKKAEKIMDNEYTGKYSIKEAELK